MFKSRNSVLAIAISILLVLATIPFEAIGADSNGGIEKGYSAEMEASIVDSKSTISSTTFDLGEGKQKTVLFSEPVRFEEDGELIDYDPSLVAIEKGKKTENGKSLSDYAYESKAGDKKQYFPEQISEDSPIIMENDKYSIEFSPIAVKEEKLSKSQQIYSEKQKREPQIEKGKFKNAENEEKKLPLKAVYEIAESGAKFEYTSSDIGVKEEVVLNEQPESNIIKYQLRLNDLIAKKDEKTGGIIFLDKETEEEVAGISAANMNDASRKAYSEKLNYELEDGKAEGEYLITLTIDENYLKAEERQYPVTIDPTVTWKGSSEMWDAYVCNGSAYQKTNFYSSSITQMAIGGGSQGTFRTYMKFLDLKTTLAGRNVISANLKIIQTGGGQSGQTIKALRAADTWSAGSITWANQPGTAGSTLDTSASSSAAGTARTLSILSYCKALAANTIDSTGIILMRNDTSGGFSSFYSARHGTSANRPTLTVSHEEIPKTPNLANLIMSPNTSANSYSKEAVSFLKSGVVGTNIKTVQYSINGSVYKTLNTSAGNSTKYEILNTDLGAPGIKTIKVKVTESLANLSAEKSFTYYYDNVLPEVDSELTYIQTIAAANLGSNWTKDSNPLIKFGGLKDVDSQVNIAASEILYAIKSAKTEELPLASEYKQGLDFASVTGNNVSGYSGSFRLTTADRNMADGAYNIYIKFSDIGGNYIAYSLPYKKDTKAPEAEIKTMDMAGENILTLSDISKRVSKISDEGSGIRTSAVELYQGATKRATLLEPRKASGMAYINTRAYLNGNYQLKLNATDKVGNTKNVTKEITISNKITRLYLNANNTQGTNYKISWAYYDTYPALQKLQYRVNTGAWVDVQTFTLNSGTFNVNLPTSYGNSIYIRGVDTSGASGKEFLLRPQVETAIVQDTVERIVEFDSYDVWGERTVTWYGTLPAGALELGFNEDEEFQGNTTYFVSIAGQTSFEMQAGQRYSLSNFASILNSDAQVEITSEKSGRGEYQVRGQNLSVFTGAGTSTDTSGLAPYQAQNVKLIQNVNYKTYLSWDNPTLPTNVGYDVYRSTVPNFSMVEGSKVASNIKSGSFSDIKINYAEKYYYKIYAVRIGTEIRGLPSAEV
ncbi:MAG: DNRLRE domain-containing protein [Anaerovoracaceae bacterium]